MAFENLVRLKCGKDLSLKLGPHNRAGPLVAEVEEYSAPVPQPLRNLAEHERARIEKIVTYRVYQDAIRMGTWPVVD
jgi:hypothetical protein